MNYSFVFFLNSALLGVGLAMDAFSVSLANGLHEPKMRMKKDPIYNHRLYMGHLHSYKRTDSMYSITLYMSLAI